MIFIAAGLYASPLEGGFALAPRASASESEKAQVYVNARLRVIDASKKYLGVPYRYSGMSASGLDCSGLICLSFSDALGVSLPRSASGLYTWAVRITIDRAQPGDLLFFRTDTTNNISHVGLYLGDRRFIHSASAGSSTGVIYSSIDEPYWAGAFAGAGRAFPEAPAELFNNEDNFSYTGAGGENAGQTTGSQNIEQSDDSQNAEQSAEQSGAADRQSSENIAQTGRGRLLAGAAIAPIWNTFVKGGELVRGVSAQFYVYADTYSFGSRMVFGLELRPEYDGALKMFRLPITLSWGPNEKIRVFLGPVISFKDASILIKGKERHYSKGISWFGAVGVTAAPFDITLHSGVLSPYLEIAWQSYLSDNQPFDIAADFQTGFRFSTGIRWLIQIK